jgi:molybdopterin-guanine dinucleotide biosynthesis protein A
VDALAAILAGGRGTRVGGGKPSLLLAGRPLISYPLAAAREAGFEVAVLAKPSTSLPPLHVPVIAEPAEPHHPLCGVIEALRRSGGRAVLAVACDLPFVPPRLLEWLASLPDPLAVPEVDGRVHPVLARYSPELLEPLQVALDETRPLQEIVRSLGPRTIGEDELARFGDPRRITFNVNRPEDVAEGERLLGTAS